MRPISWKEAQSMTDASLANAVAMATLGNDFTEIALTRTGGKILARRQGAVVLFATFEYTAGEGK